MAQAMAASVAENRQPDLAPADNHADIGQPLAASCVKLMWTERPLGSPPAPVRRAPEDAPGPSVDHRLLITRICPAMPHRRYSLPLLAVTLTACVSLPPEGPSVMALPGSGRSFEAFRADDAWCRNYAQQSISPKTPETAAVNAGVASAAVGTAVVAAVGAAVDGSSGAAVGAGFGLLVGSASGVSASNASSYELQRRYDQSYVQCMYARGHKVPVIAGYYSLPSSSAPSSPAPTPPPPPPRGAPPPPPPR